MQGALPDVHGLYNLRCERRCPLHATSPEYLSLQPVTADWIYAPPLNAIYSVSSGALIWMNSDQAATSAVSGPYIVYSFGSQVLAKTY